MLQKSVITVFEDTLILCVKQNLQMTSECSNVSSAFYIELKSIVVEAFTYCCADNVTFKQLKRQTIVKICSCFLTLDLTNKDLKDCPFEVHTVSIALYNIVYKLKLH